MGPGRGGGATTLTDPRLRRFSAQFCQASGWLRVHWQEAGARGCRCGAENIFPVVDVAGRRRLRPGSDPTACAQTLELLRSKPSKHPVPDFGEDSSFGEDYGSYCAAWEDGACSESLDLKKCTNGPGHTCGSKKGCHELWDGYNFNQDQLWCVVFARRERLQDIQPHHIQP